MTESPLQDDRQGAVFSDDREFRYRLWRTWGVDKPAIAFIALNPSTADETTDDPTVRRCLGFAEDWGYGTLLVGNIFAYRATNPDELYDHPNPVGEANTNDHHLKDMAESAERTVVAWGHHGDHLGRGRAVAGMLEYYDIDLYALDTTQEGHPAHPLYQPGDIEPEPFSYEDSEPEP